MFDISLPAAERWFNISNAILVIGAVAVAAGTYGVIMTDAVKERFANERIKANEAETARAVADSDVAKAQAAIANEHAAQANQKAEEERLARMKLEAKLAPRTLTGDQQQAIVEKLSPYPGTQFEFSSYQDDQEVNGLVKTLIRTLIGSGWKGLPARDFLMAGLVVGVVVEYAPESEEHLGTPARALAAALEAEGLRASVVANKEMSDHPDRIKVKVGKKP